MARTRRVAMTVGSRRLAARCRERFAADPTVLSATADPDTAEPEATVDTPEAETVMPQENNDVAAQGT
jgi:hypothetical protein